MTEKRRCVNMEQLPEAHRKIAEMLGVETALKLSECYGGEEIYIPKIDAVHNAERDAEICRLRAQGLSVKQLMERFGLGRQTIYDILGRNKDRQ